MKLKHIFFPLAIALPICSSQAVVTIIDLDLSRGPSTSSRTNVSAGTATVTATTTGTGGADQFMTYTITGLTLDSVGAADDSITFTMGLLGASSTGTVAGIAASFEYWGVSDGTGTGSLIESDETIRFDFDGATVTLGVGATETASIQFNGFTGFELLNVGAGETHDITGTTSNNGTDLANAGQENLNSFTGSETTFTYGGNTGAMRIGGVRSSVTITTVPEPSSAALVGLGGLALILRRRK